MKRSEWQDGVPPSDGIWEIAVPEHNNTYYCMFSSGKWMIGSRMLDAIKSNSHYRREVYPENNNPANPRKWRGVLET
jgi:hypothetical protein